MQTTTRVFTAGPAPHDSSPGTQWALGIWACILPFAGLSTAAAQQSPSLDPGDRLASPAWQRLPDLPDALGVAGPFVGVHRGALLVAGGANFPRPIWESSKVWRRKIHVLVAKGADFVWQDGGRLSHPIAYGAAVSTHRGVICLGGNHADQTFDRVFALHWDAHEKRVLEIDYPPLPSPCAYGQAAMIGDMLYLAGGQRGATLDSAMANLWALDLSGTASPETLRWQSLEPCPGGPRSFNLTVPQTNAADDCLYLISGRRQGLTGVRFLRDVWEYNVTRRSWRRRADAPRCVMAGTAIAIGSRSVLVLGGADGTLFDQADILKDRHPGFPQRSYWFDTTSNRWTAGAAIPQNHVTTIPVRFNGKLVIASGEIRPRVRSSWIWHIQLPVRAQADDRP